MNQRLFASLGVITLGWGLCAADFSNLKTEREKVSYTIGQNIGTGWKRQFVDVDADIVLQGIKDAMAGKASPLTDKEAADLLATFQADMRKKQADFRKKQGEENLKTGEAFRTANRAKPGVKETASGMQYKVLVEGKGALPKPTDTVQTHYKGMLIDGTEFDSSVKRGQPFTTAVSTGIIKGWSEALMMMPVGSKWQVVLPPALAYGDRGTPQGGPIGPNATLVFELELLSIQPGANEPVTSDIIKVPSAEELKKGAQIEVIKKEDLDKLQKGAQPKK